MLSHVTLGVNDLEASIIFYNAIMATIAQERRGRGDSWAGYGDSFGIGVDTLWILIPTNGQPASVGNDANVTFLAQSREAVDLFHKAALEHGGTNEGLPGIRAENHPNFYAAYVRDLTGNKLLAVCHEAT